MYTLGLTLKVIGLILLNLITANGHKFEFVYTNEEIYEKCSDIEGTNGIADLVDTTNFHMAYYDGEVEISGEMVVVWNTEPTDRLEVRFDLLKMQRGTWQPTIWTITVKDFCPQQFAEGAIWYEAWSKYVVQEDQKCLNNYKHVYHYEPTVTDNSFNLSANLEGRHKLRVMAHAIDEHQMKRPQSICFDVEGDIVKLK